jgi:hypothetical protein
MKAMKKMKTKRPPKRKTSGDIIQLILADHKPLKRLIKILKSGKDYSVKAPAFEEFAPLLLAHAHPEQESLYEYMKKEKDEDVQCEAYEGETEHSLAEEMVHAVKTTRDVLIWGAKAKVLAELVEHHIQEEEEEMLPSFRKQTELAERISLGDQYLSLKAAFEHKENTLEDMPKNYKQNQKQISSHLHH